jgi:hypothetical protein
MSRDLLETLTGVGRIYAAGRLLRTTPYHLSVWSDDESTAGTRSQTIDGTIDITGIAEAIVLAGPGALTLLLEDGRSLPFTLVGTSGRIVARGAFGSAT